MAMPESSVPLPDRRNTVPAAFRSTDRWLLTLLERVNDIISVVSPEGVVMFRSGSCLRCTGFAPDEVIGQPATIVAYHEDQPAMLQLFMDILKAGPGTEVRAEIRLAHKQLGYAWFETVVLNAVDDPNVRGVIFTCRDINDRKLAQEKLQRSEQRFRAAFETAQDLLIVMDKDGFLRDVSVRALNNIMGFELHDVLGLHARDFVHPEDLPKVRRMRDSLPRMPQRTDPVAPELVRLRTRSGEWRWMETVGVNLFDDPAVNGLVITARDVHARVLAERTLRTQGAVLDTMREGVLLVDSAGAIRLNNPASQRMFGCPAADLRGKKLEDMFVGTGRLQDLMQKDAAVEVLCRRHDGSEFVAEVMWSPLVFDGESLTVFVLLDATDRRRLENELLHVANREQQRIGSDLHDGLGQELTGIALLLRGLSRRFAVERPDVASRAEEISALVSHAVETARSLAQGLSPVHLERGGLDAALTALVKQARSLYGIEVTLDRSGGPLEITDGRALHLYRIAQEALTNAVRHGHARHVQVLLDVQPLQLRLQIADDGAGMSAGSDQATGLGLRIMQYRSRMLGGKLGIEATAGGGVTIRCECPLQPHAAAEVVASID